MKTLRKLQIAQLYMIKEIAKICEENHLRYYLCGGTLLGAVRHQGFIPWDDDLDITMYREDLEKLTRIIQENYKDTFFVQNFDTDKNYARYITKIRLNGTLQVEEDCSQDDMHQGIYIDIFPLDHVTKSDGFGLHFRGKMLRLLFAYKTARCTKNKQSTPLKMALIKLLKPFTYLIPNSAINKMFDYVCSATDKPGASYTTSFASHYLWKKQLVPNAVYGEGVLHKFENCELRIPSDYTTLLVQLFGENYMDIPPVEKRNSGHVLVNVDLGKYEDIVCNIDNALEEK